MKKTLLTATLFTFFLSNAQEPILHWAKKAGAAGYDVGIDLTTDANGNVITVGSFNLTADFDPGAGVFNMTGLGNNDGFIQKLDASGNFMWAKQISGTMIEAVHKVSLDASGNIYLAGEYMATVDFNPGPAVFNMTSTTHVIPSLKSIDVFIVKLDPEGNFLWAKSFGGAEYDAVTGMELDANGNIILGGYFSLTVDFDPGAGTFPLTSTDGNDDMYLSKLDPDGNFIWSKRIGGTGDDHLKSMAIDSDGNIYGTGYFYGPADFDPNAGTFNLLPSAPDPANGLLQDMFVVKLQSDGELGWAKKIGGDKGEMAEVITVDDSGNVITAGSFYGTVDFDPGDAESLLTSAFPLMFFSKLSVDGNFVWAKSIENSNNIMPQMLRGDINGTFFMAADYRNAAAFGENISVMSSSGDSEDVLIAKFDADGNGIFVKSMGGSGDDTIFAIQLTTDGSIYSTGSFSGTSDMDPDSGVSELTSNGSNDLFVHRLSPESLAIPENYFGNNIIIANPSQGVICIDASEEWSGAAVDVFNIAGQRVDSFVLPQPVYQHQLASGTYLLDFTRGNKKAAVKIGIR